MLLIALAASACSSKRSAVVSHPSFCTQFPTATCIVVHNGRFTVAAGSRAVQSARAVGISLPTDVTRALGHIGSLLPGPSTSIGIVAGTAVIPETGDNGFTNPTTGGVTIILDPQSRIPYSQTLETWLPRALSHEVDHSVRVLGGPGFGTTLLEYLVSEGLADAFDVQAWSGPTNPWDGVLTPTEETALWRQAQSALTVSGVPVYDKWFFGGAGIPRWSGFTIGYHIVQSYLARHQRATAASIVHEPASSILAGSGYAP
jgi:hypothetical protein